jgi:ABC-type glycerol-3-phosphate transport system permease component
MSPAEAISVRIPRRAKARRDSSDRVRRPNALIYVPIALLAVGFGGPFLWTIMTSLKLPRELYMFPPTLFPNQFAWGNYVEIWRQVPLALFFRNSVVITVSAMAGQIISAALVAYGFARFRFPGRNVLFLLVLSTLMLPTQVTLVPTFILFRELNWLDSYRPLIVPMYLGGGAFSIFLCRQFFMTIPKEYDEAAKIDGASSFRILVQIIVPMSKPVFITLAIFAFLSSWNSFFYPLIYLNTLEKFTLQLGLQYFRRAADAGGEPTEHLLLAAAMVMTLPCIVLFLALQKYFIRGIVSTGIKG